MNCYPNESVFPMARRRIDWLVVFGPEKLPIFVDFHEIIQSWDFDSQSPDNY